MTGFSWKRIFSRNAPWLMKITYLVLSAIPFVGPIFYFLIDPTENQTAKIPSEKLWESPKKGTAVWPSFDPLIKFLRGLFSS
jgi:hypothetical protein